MKGQRKRMRKAILSEMGSNRPWLETVEMLQAKGIPLNLILHEANEYGKRRFSKPNSKDRAREA